jgi:uncharacterized membrane protein
MKTIKIALKYLLCAFMVFAGVMHFRNPDFYLKMMSPYLPWHSGLLMLVGLQTSLFIKFQQYFDWNAGDLACRNLS